MSRKEEDTLERFLERHGAEIGKIITAFAKGIEEGPKQRQRNMQMVMLFMLGVVAIVSVLGYLRIVSGDSVTFLIGSIVGYSFAFLKGYLAPGTP